MDPLPKSGFNLPNRLARTTLLALEELVGDNNLQALLNLAHLDHLIEGYPPANLEKGFDFADFSALFLALDEMYGERGGRGLALRAGRLTFKASLSNFGALAGTGDLAFKGLPTNTKLKIGLSAMAKIFSEISDQRTSLKDRGEHFEYIVHRNPVCWGRRDEEKPVCYYQVSLLEEAMHLISGGREFRVDEAECQAMGALTCVFILQKEAIG